MAWCWLAALFIILVAVLGRRAFQRRWPTVPTSPLSDLSDPSYPSDHSSLRCKSCSQPITHGLLCDTCLYNQLHLINQHAARERKQYQAYLSPKSHPSH